VAFRRLFRRIANPVVRRVLRSPLHRLLSARLLLLAYRGRRTGRRYELPLLYARDGGGVLLVALTPDGHGWWRNVRGREVELLVAGRTLTARAELAADAEAARAAFARALPWSRPVLRRAPRAVFVRATPSE